MSPPWRWNRGKTWRSAPRPGWQRRAGPLSNNHIWKCPGGRSPGCCCRSGQPSPPASGGTRYPPPVPQTTGTYPEKDTLFHLLSRRWASAGRHSLPSERPPKVKIKRVGLCFSFDSSLFPPIHSHKVWPLPSNPEKAPYFMFSISKTCAVCPFKFCQKPVINCK